MNKLRYKVYTFKHSLYTFIFPIHRIYMIEKTKAKNLKKLAGWEILFIPISPMRLCPTPCTVMRYKGLNLPSVLDMSHSKPWVERSGGESGQRIRGLGRGYYLSGHGSLHIFHACSQGVFAQLLAHCIHLKCSWVTCGLHKALLLIKSRWDKKHKRWDLKDRHNTENIQLYFCGVSNTYCLIVTLWIWGLFPPFPPFFSHLHV